MLVIFIFYFLTIRYMLVSLQNKKIYVSWVGYGQSKVSYEICLHAPGY